MRKIGLLLASAAVGCTLAFSVPSASAVSLTPLEQALSSPGRTLCDGYAGTFGASFSPFFSYSCAGNFTNGQLVHALTVCTLSAGQFSLGAPIPYATVATVRELGPGWTCNYPFLRLSV